MANGDVIEQGSHGQLVALDGYYAKLVHAQDLGRSSNDLDGGSREDATEKTDEPSKPLNPIVSVRAAADDRSEETPREKKQDRSLLVCVILMFLEQKTL